MIDNKVNYLNFTGIFHDIQNSDFAFEEPQANGQTGKFLKLLCNVVVIFHYMCRWANSIFYA